LGIVLAAASAYDCLVKSVVWLGTNVIVSSTNGEVRHADEGVGVCFGGGSGLLTAPGNPLYGCETTSADNIPSTKQAGIVKRGGWPKQAATLLATPLLPPPNHFASFTFQVLT